MLCGRRLLLALAGTCLTLTSAAAADPADNRFTAVSTPSNVQPAPALATYTITLTNDPAPSEVADQAMITPPPGFAVVGQPLDPTVSGCEPNGDWEAQVLPDGAISLARAGGSANNLCAGGTLTVVFSASAAASEGTYTWGVELRRGEGAEEQLFTLHDAQLTVKVDGTPPQTTIVSGPDPPTNQSSAIFSFSSNEAGATFECSLDGGDFSPCISPKSYSGLAEGIRTFAVRAIDKAGNMDGTAATHVWTVDVTPPDTTIDLGQPPSPTNQTSATFHFSSNEVGATFACSLNGAAFSSCTSPKSYGSLAEGLRTFAVRATDQAGNTDGTAATHAWTVDVTDPNTTIDSGQPPSPTNQTSASFTFSSNEAGATFECRLDSPTFSQCTSPESYSGLPAGPHTFAVRATDPAGNIDTSPAADSWTIDLTAPTTTIISGPPSSTNLTSATFTFSSEAGATFECNLDGSGFSACTSPRTYSGLHEGPHRFEVRAKDLAGNTDETSAIHTWTIDLIGPPTTILTGPPVTTNSTSATFTFSSEAGTTFECSLDGAVFFVCPNPHTYSGLGQGPHLFAVRAIDAAKNSGPASSRSWTIDTRMPTTTLSSGPAVLSNSRSATFAFSADEPSSFQCQLDGGGLQPCTSPVSYQGLSDGGHTFVVTPTDTVGNSGAASSASWTIDATAPETTVTSGPRSGTTTVSATFRFAANEPVTFECKLDAAAFAPCASPKSYARLKRGQHSFTVRATDAARNVDATPAAHRWAIGAPAPRTAKKSSALLAPPPGARVSSPPLLRWRPDSRARFYNVQLFRGRVKVLSVWPRRTSLRLRARWTYLGRKRTLSPGPYRWYVWPAYRSNRYGPLLGQSTFTVRAK